MPQRPVTIMRACSLALLTLMLPGCESRVTLSVRVRSDLEAGDEVREIRGRVFSGTVACDIDSARDVVGDVQLTLETSEAAALRAGSLTILELTLAPGVYTVAAEAALVDGSIRRCAVVTLGNDRVATLSLTGDCAGVTCPAPGGSPGFSECEDAQCVDPRCDHGDPSTARWCCDPLTRDDCASCLDEELCNGMDDDCDTRVDEDATCAVGVCARPAGGGETRCLDPGSCLDVGCPADERCEPTTLTCVSRVGPDGTPCSASDQCDSGRCYPRSALGLGDSGGVCSRACCTDAECASDLHCAAPGTGARGCVVGPATRVACARVEDCPGSTTCSLSAAGFECRAPVGATRANDFCSENSDCESGVCIENLCRAPCGTASDCPSSPLGAPACRALNSPAGWINGCSYDSTGLSEHGERCRNNAECREALCWLDAMSCAGSCCSDTQCPSGTVCTPVDHFGWEMRCVASSGSAG